MAFSKSSRGRRVGRLALIATLSTGVTLAATPAYAGSADDWKIAAHRGGTEAAPEHTLAAFTHMINRKADAVEMDILFTRDNEAIVFHDSTLDKRTNCSGPVSRKTLSQIKKCDAGSWFSPKFKGERIQTLKEALRFIDRGTNSDFQYFLHVKTKTRANARKIANIVKDVGLRKQVVPIANNRLMLGYLQDAGLKKVGLVFNDAAGYRAGLAAGYKFLIPYNVTFNDSVLREVERRGRVWMPVEGHPYSLNKLDSLDVPAVLVNDLDKALKLAGRLLSQPENRVGTPADTTPGTSPPAEDPPVTASSHEYSSEGPMRTTGPMDF
ncbi:MAG: glycerophosphodiester phosphodiesterase [Sporichthyaceae bacterium]